jgi:Holliday junction resolvasome RuvABC endonuclease subunit
MKILHVLSIDPGPTWMGWAHLRIEYGPGCRTTYQAGGEEECSRHAFKRLAWRVFTAAEGETDGKEEVRTNEEKPFTKSDVRMVVAIESPAGAIFSPARSAQLLLTTRRAGGLAMLAEDWGHKVIEATAQQIRQVMCGKGNADDKTVNLAVKGNVFLYPETKNSHVADAVAVGLVGGWIAIGNAVLPTPKPKAEKQKRKGK